ncbi:MAG: PilZ domain-containing protein [Candidatus Omnitrophica bacterium]|nr:PilZ domain-containing protein [Candidatus Omnitrophota bacterium]
MRLHCQHTPRLVETLTKDISTGGLRCLSPVPQPVGSPVSVELTLGNGYRPVVTRGSVVWFQSIPGSEQFYLGIGFSDITEQDSKYLSSYLSKIYRQILPANSP